MSDVEYLDVTTGRGQQAWQAVMQQSYQADASGLPPEWTVVRVVDGEPVSFVIVDPHRCMDFPAGQVPYAFICDIATRQDRRGEGHFTALMGYVLERLRAEGQAMVILHGRHSLYRRLGFEVFTHHSGIFISPEQIERRLGAMDPAAAHDLAHTMGSLDDLDHPTALLIVGAPPFLWPDLLAVPRVLAQTPTECRMALQAAAAIAREQGRTRILIQHPFAPSYGSHYPIYASPETSLTVLARVCGGQVVVQGADPESGAVPDADWVRVLDAAAFTAAVLRCRPVGGDCPDGVLGLDTDVGALTIACEGRTAQVVQGIAPGVRAARWPAGAWAQLVIGYLPADVLAVIYGIPLSSFDLALLQALFPPLWRFSWNESWLFRS